MTGICGMGLNFTLDGFRTIYCAVAALMWACTTCFSVEYFRSSKRHLVRYYVFTLLTFLSVIGVFVSADLFTVFVFFEIMSFTSFVWVAHDEREVSLRAAYTYLAIAVIGGLVTLMGLWMLYDLTGTLVISELPAATETVRDQVPQTRLWITGGLLATGFAAKAGVWPLHIWLPKAHPVAPAPSSALLSGILTKTGIFGLLAITCGMFDADPAWGLTILLLGVITMFTGALLAMFSIDLKRTLACSSLSQIGFILTGMGMYSIAGASDAAGECVVIAARGTLLHMLGHSMIKLILFMAAGVIYMNTHRLDLNDIRGYGRRKPLLAAAFLMGAASISGIPFTAGYISKTLLHEAISEYAHMAGSGAVFFEVIGWIFLLCGGMTLSYMLKLFVAIFVEKGAEAGSTADHSETADDHAGTGRSYFSPLSAVSILLPALILLIAGLMPEMILKRICAYGAPFFGLSAEAVSETAVHFYSWGSLSGALISVTIGCVLYFGVIRTLMMAPDPEKGSEGCRVYVNRWPAWLDLEDRVYRPVLLGFIPAVLGFVCAIVGEMTDYIIVKLRATTHRQIATRVPVGSLEDQLAVSVGEVLDSVVPHKNGSSHIPTLIEREERYNLTQRFISGTLSFGLILVCVGLIMVLLYTLRLVRL